MASEASSTYGQPGPSHFGTGRLESIKNTFMPNQPPRARGQPPINRDAFQNVDALITQLTTIVVQIAIMMNKVKMGCQFLAQCKWLKLFLTI